LVEVAKGVQTDKEQAFEITDHSDSVVVVAIPDKCCEFLLRFNNGSEEKKRPQSSHQSYESLDTAY
jgi:hypothetical protein